MERKAKGLKWETGTAHLQKNTSGALPAGKNPIEFDPILNCEMKTEREIGCNFPLFLTARENVYHLQAIN